ncbi:MAG: methyltransferase domain-containing protein [Candidatus Krumholzibacteria bacterium]|nr:methyltransferase domain-containing protein [Candidatus Krumholzibacteria bacterium]
MNLPEPLIPDDIPEDRMPSLLRNWFLGAKAKRYLSRRRFQTVTGMLPAASGGRALDVGCGWGYNLFLLRARGYRPVGIDIVQNDFLAASMIADANGYEIDLLGADMSSLPFRSEQFDAVTAVETFEHVFYPDRKRAIREVGRILAPGGTFILSTPNYFSLVESAKRIVVGLPFLKRVLPVMCYPVGDVSREQYHPYSYHRPAPLKEIAGMLESEGFEIMGARKIIFIWKSVPDILFPLCLAAETFFEKIPLIRGLGSTLVVVAKKRVGGSG